MVTDIEVIVNSSIIVSLDVTLLIVKDHATLENLDYAHSGHTGFASSEALNNGLATKLDKVTSTGENRRAYIVTTSGGQSVIVIANASLADAIPVRNDSGTFMVGTPSDNSHVVPKIYVDNSIAALLENGKIKATLIPDEFDEVMEFEKEVSGASFIDATLATEVGSIVWCAATKPIAGDTYYRKFIVNNDGTQAGLTTIDPAKGKLYVGKTANNLFGWSGSNLLEISKSLSLGETATTAYAGNKGKANAQAIAALQAKQLQVVGFYDSAYPSLNRLTFPTSQTQIIFFGYKYDSGDPIKGGSVPLFNDNIMELAPNSPNNEYFRVKAETSGSNTVLTIYQNLMSYVRFLVVETNVDLTGGA